ncbi:37S ribosomal [Hyphodiscus hymeniophilus]|uniref:37S ribosomal n=1 Tax=Hyphodiscus hymeniophilus TaxID=353542 RepID=A0A9P6SQX6_9HELO|nr:37S ribosomal [Hyphodiscus hymeniophilus]
MATALQSFRLTVRSCQCRPRAQQYLTRSVGRRRAFNTVRPLLQDSDKSTGRFSGIHEDESNGLSEKELAALEKLEAQSKEIAKLSDDDPTKRFKQLSHGLRTLEQSGLAEEYNSDVMEALDETGLIQPEVTKKTKKLKNTFLNLGEQEPFEDDDFDMETNLLEDMNSLAHGELEQHREMRHYARLAAWEMPLLSKYAKPFEPPTQTEPLRFRYTTYMGEQHPAEKKVVMEFCTQDMPDLTQIQRSKLIKLAGVRYNPETDIVKMSCEMFPSQAQNKRYLGDAVNDMLREARDPTDTFEDVPFDMRHHKFTIKPTFPQSWKMTRERKEELAKLRANAELKDQRRLLTGQLVDGVKQIEEAFSRAAAQPSPVPAMAMAGKGAGTKGKAKKVAVRR